MNSSAIYKGLFYGVLIGHILSWYFIFKGKSNSSGIGTEIVHVTDTLFLPSPVQVDSIIVPVPAEIDTAAILNQYFTKHIYRDTLIQTKFVKVHITDTVYMNRLLGRVVDYNLSFPVYNQALSLGTVGGYKNLSLLAGYRHKRWEFLGGYDFYNKSLMVGAKYTLFRWQ